MFTTITKEGMPIIRYRTRDLTRLLPGSVRTMRRMEKIVGRSDDMMIIRGVNVFPSQIEEQILQISKLLPNYQIHIIKHGHLDTLRVHVESCSDASDLEVTQLANKLKQNIKTMVGISVQVDVLPQGMLPRSEGKAQRVVDLRNVAVPA